MPGLPSNSQITPLDSISDGRDDFEVLNHRNRNKKFELLIRQLGESTPVAHWESFDTIKDFRPVKVYMKNLPRSNTRFNSRNGRNATKTNAPVTNACYFVNEIKLDSPNKGKNVEISNEDKICRMRHRSKTLQDIRDYFDQQKILLNIGAQSQNENENENSSEISFDISLNSPTISNIKPNWDQISMYPNHTSHHSLNFHSAMSELIPDNNLDFCSQNLINKSNYPPSVD